MTEEKKALLEPGGDEEEGLANSEKLSVEIATKIGPKNVENGVRISVS
jgi:hypothetical protein